MMKPFLILMITFLASLNLGGIETATAATPHEVISNRLNRYVAEALSLDPSEIEIAQLKPTRGQSQLFPGKITLIRPAKPGRLLGRVLFALTMRQPQRNPFVQWVIADIAWVKEVVVATHSLKRHHIIAEGDLAIQKIRIQKRQTPYTTDTDRLLGKRIIRSLRTGEAIRTDRVEDAPVIQRGDRIMITLKTEGLSISTFGKAREDGLQGEIIKVINLDTRKIIFAKVVGPGRVRIGSMMKE